MLRNRLRGLRKTWLKRWQPSPTVGVYTTGKRFAQIAHQQGIEQDLVAVLQPAQEHVAREIALRQLAQRPQPAADLLVEAGDVRRQQAVQPENLLLLLAERRALVEQRIVEQLVAAQFGLDERPVRRSASRPTLGVLTLTSRRTMKDRS